MAAKDDYVCTLTEASLKKAKEELYEDPPNRLGAVETLRKWINNQPYIKCATDTSFLLRFLRPSKFSQLETRKMLEKFLTSKLKLPEWMENIDMQNEKIQAFLKTGYMTVLPGYDKEGRRIILLRPGCMDTSGKSYKKSDLIKGQAGLTLALVQDENTQVNGFSMFVDLTDYTMKKMSYISADEKKKMVKAYTGTFPTRLKVIHYYNTGPVFEAVMAIMMPFFEQKMRNRFVIHGNTLEGIYDVIPMEMLPVEYLPDDYTGPNAGTLEEVIEYTRNLVSNDKTRKRLLYESGKDFMIDPSQKIDDVPVASFRSLSTD